MTTDERPPQRPETVPIGLHLTKTARVVGRAFDTALTQAGGSLPIWLVLLNVKIKRSVKQRDLAAAVGVTEATLTHHLTTLEREGLVTRRRDDSNRRVQVVELTAAGETHFIALRDAAIAFDAQLKQGFDEADAAQLAELLDRLAANAAPLGDGAPSAAPGAERTASAAPGAERTASAAPGGDLNRLAAPGGPAWRGLIEKG